MTLGEKITHYRKQNGVNQRQLASQLGITPTRLNYWEKDKRMPDLLMAQALADGLGVSLEALLGPQTQEEERETMQRAEMERALRRLDVIDADGNIDNRKIDALIDILKASKQILG